MEGKDNRKCEFKECLSYYDGKELKQFKGSSPGFIATEKRGIDKENKWSDLWYIFEPSGSEKTLAEMSEEERENRIRVNSKSSLKEFAKWYEEVK